jgi:endothelin-converting enzyme
MIPEIDILRYTRTVVPKEYEIGPDTIVNLEDKYYFGNLSSILKKTTRETLHDYLSNVILQEMTGRVHTNFSEPFRRVGNIKDGKKPDTKTPRHKTCLSSVESVFRYMYSGLYISQAEFSAKDKNLGDRIVSEIRDVFKERLSTLDWLSDNVRPTALKKGKALPNYLSQH